MKSLKTIFTVSLFVILAVLLAQISTAAAAAAGITYGVFIFTAAGGVGVNFQFNITYLPEFIYYNDGGNPLNFLRVETAEDGVLHDWNAACIAAMNGFMHPGALAANAVLLRIADGEIKNKQVTVTGQTSAVGAINLFVNSDNQGVAAFKTANLNVLANNPTTVTKFTALFLPNLLTIADRVEVTFDDGHQQTFDALELNALSTLYQNAPGIILNNVNGYIKKAIVTDAAGGAAYVLSVAIPGQ